MLPGCWHAASEILDMGLWYDLIIKRNIYIFLNDREDLAYW